MKIKTDSALVKKAREGVMEFLLVRAAHRACVIQLQIEVLNCFHTFSSECN